MRIVALAGGVGGAKLAHGLSRIVAPHDLTIIVNTADDFDHLGLHISPDLDTVCYTLAGVGNPATGWGRAGETWNAIQAIEELGGPAWFRLGDKDFATHVWRSELLRRGHPLSEIVRAFCHVWGVEHTVLPMSDDAIRTIVKTEQGELEFQEYFVRERCQPRVTGFEFRGAKTASPAPGVMEALESAEAVVICPSNPWVSIGPILAVPGLQEIVAARITIAISPIVGGRTIKGPADKMYSELGIAPSALAVARHYVGIASAFVMDKEDAAWEQGVRQLGMRALVTKTIMQNVRDRQQLARDVLNFIRAG